MTTDPVHADPSPWAPSAPSATKTVDPAFGLLRVVFTVLPVVFGLDKFVGVLTD